MLFAWLLTGKHSMNQRLSRTLECYGSYSQLECLLVLSLSNIFIKTCERKTVNMFNICD